MTRGGILFGIKGSPGCLMRYSGGDRQGLGLDELTGAEETWGLGAAGPQTSGTACLALIFTPPYSVIPHNLYSPLCPCDPVYAAESEMKD